MCFIVHFCLGGKTSSVVVYCKLFHLIQKKKTEEERKENTEKTWCWGEALARSRRRIKTDKHGREWVLKELLGNISIIINLPQFVTPLPTAPVP